MNFQSIITPVSKAGCYCFLIIELYLLCETVYLSFKKRNRQRQQYHSAANNEIDYETLLRTLREKTKSSERPVQSIADFCVNGNSAEELHTRLENVIWNTALFFPDILPRSEGSTTNKLIWYLNQAKRSIKLCLFSISFGQLEKALEDVRKKGVDIKAVVHTPPSGRRLTRRGVSTKVWKQSVTSKYDPTSTTYIDLMHHKFLIIDDKYLLNGSLNWTREGITGNNENIMITTNYRAVKRYLSEFNKMWSLSEVQIPPNEWSQCWNILRKDTDVDSDKND